MPRLRFAAAVASEWERDSIGQELMSREMFIDAVWEVADTWTRGVSEEEVRRASTHACVRPSHVARTAHALVCLRRHKDMFMCVPLSCIAPTVLCVSITAVRRLSDRPAATHLVWPPRRGLLATSLSRVN